MLRVNEPKGRSPQLLWSHVDCLGKTLNKIPFSSLSDRIDIYDEWVQEQVKNLEVGHLVEGAIAFIKDYGMGIEISKGFHALLHVSEISQQSIEDLNKIFCVGDFVRALIIDIDRPKGRISLSTSRLEIEKGDMVRNSQKFYDRAEEMAARYCRTALGKNSILKMAFSKLTPEEQHVVYQCLKASIEGPFFPDCEFSTLFGLSKEEFIELIKTWPELNHNSSEARVAINNSLNNLLGYPHKKHDVWHEYISVEPSQLAVIFQKWRGDDSFDPDAYGFFNRMM